MGLFCSHQEIVHLTRQLGEMAVQDVDGSILIGENDEMACRLGLVWWKGVSRRGPKWLRICSHLFVESFGNVNISLFCYFRAIFEFGGCCIISMALGLPWFLWY